MLTYGDVLRKVVHFLLIVALAIPLYWRGVVETFFLQDYLPAVETLSDPGVVYALVLIGAAFINAVRIRGPISREKVIEFRKKAAEIGPFGKKIEELLEAVDSLINAMQREYERRAGYLGLVYGTIGIFTAYSLFGYEVVYGISAMATTDIFSSLIGMAFGKRRIPFSNGTFEGTIAGFLSFLLPLLIVEPPWRAFILALSASFAEVYGVEDNLSVPLFVSFVSWLTREFSVLLPSYPF
ncbi:MAG: hypothetical protein DRO05_03420 [Thermoproteota archaeon]|nr:MAG: hypothetical protein DRO05_03420 [Candidatus Korarchaeota archaeon]